MFPKVEPMPRLKAFGSFFMRSIRSRPLRIGESGRTAMPMYSAMRCATGVISVYVNCERPCACVVSSVFDAIAR